MSVAYSIKVSVDQSSEENAKRAKEREVEEFIHRFRFLLDTNISYVDPVAVAEFRRHAKEYLRDSELEARYRDVILSMERNLRLYESRRYLGEDYYRPVWFL